MVKLKVYVHSFEVPTVGFSDRRGAVDKEGQKGADWGAQAQNTAFRGHPAQTTPFQGLDQHAILFEKRYLSDEDREVLMRIDNFCKNNGLEYEVVDVGKISLLAKLELRMRGIKTSAVCAGEKKRCGIPSDEDMKKLLMS